MRILHVLFLGDIGGIESYAPLMLATLEAQGHDNRLALGGRPAILPHRAAGSYHFFPELGQFARPSRAVQERFLSVAHAQQPEVLFLHCRVQQEFAIPLTRQYPTVLFAHNYSHFCPSGSLHYARTGAVCERRRPGVPCIAHAFIDRCNSRRPDRLYYTLRRSTESLSWLRMTQQIVVGSRFVKQRYVEAGVQAERIHVLPYPITFPETLPAGGAVTPVDILFVGRVTAEKGLDALLRACALLRRPATVAVVGDGLALASARRLCARLGLVDRVTFHGALPRAAIQAFYDAARIVAFPSLWSEPFGMVGPEAMSHGKPLVAFNVGGVGDWLEHEVNGLLAAPGDVVAFARHLERLLDDDALRTRMGECGRQKAYSLYGIDRHVAGLLRVFDAAVASFRARSGVTVPPVPAPLDYSG